MSNHMTAKPETFWLVSGEGFYDCIGHVLTPRPDHQDEDQQNPRFQLVMHDGSTHEDIVTAHDITHAEELALLSKAALRLAYGGKP